MGHEKDHKVSAYEGHWFLPLSRYVRVGTSEVVCWSITIISQYTGQIIRSSGFQFIQSSGLYFGSHRFYLFGRSVLV